jgi:hypothetical protein
MVKIIILLLLCIVLGVSGVVVYHFGWKELGPFWYGYFNDPDLKN